MLQAYLLYFNTQISKFAAEILSIDNNTSDVLNKELKRYLQSDGYEFYDYSDEIAIIVDDRGFEKRHNPVFELVSAFGDTTQLAGRLIFVRNIENEFSVDIGSIEANDIEILSQTLDIKLLGITKGVE